MMQTGNLRQAKLRLMNAPELVRLLVRCGWSEIMLDLDDDAEPDVCFSDENNDGDIDTISIDLTGNGEFNLFLHDADGSGHPDTIFYADDGSDHLETLASGSEVEEKLKSISQHLYDLLLSDDIPQEQMAGSLEDLRNFLKEDLTTLLNEVHNIAAPESQTGADIVCRFLEDAGVYYLATAEGDQPRVRPFGTILLYEGHLYIQTGKVKDVSKQLAVNPRAELCAFLNGTWLRLSGTLVNDDRIEVKQAMLDKYPNLGNMYSAEDDNTQVLYFENATAIFSSFTAAPEIIEL